MILYLKDFDIYSLFDFINILSIFFRKPNNLLIFLNFTIHWYYNDLCYFFLFTTIDTLLSSLINQSGTYLNQN